MPLIRLQLTLLVLSILSGAQALAQSPECAPAEGSGDLAAAQVARAHCLRDAAFARFSTIGYLGHEMPPAYHEGLALIDEAVPLLEGPGQEGELSQLLFDVAMAMPMGFITGDISFEQSDMTARRDAYLSRAAEIFAGLAEGEHELLALRSLSRPTIAQLTRRVALAETLEGASSMGLAADLEWLSLDTMEDDPVASSAILARAIAIHDAVAPDTLEVAELRLRRALIEARNGNRDASRTLLEEALTVYQAQSSHDRISYLALYLGSYALETGDLASARSYYDLALSHADSPRHDGEARIGLGLVNLVAGDEATARLVIGAGSPPSWAILTSEFNRYFFGSTIDSGMKDAAMRLFTLMGASEAATAIRDNWR